MSADGEVVALRASGIGIAQLLPPVLAVGLVAAGILSLLTFELEPRARLALKDLVRELGTSTRLATPGRFRSLGRRTFYVRSAGDETCPLEGVFLADFSEGEEPMYIAARCGALRAGEDETSIRLELVDGSVHLPEDSPDAYRRLTFTRMETRLDLTRFLNPGLRSRNLTFMALLQANAAFRRGEGPQLRGREGVRQVRIEIHRRLAFSLSCVLLAILAVPLGVRPVRVGRSWGALTALVVMAGYWLVLSGGELAAEEGMVPPWAGLWAGDLGVLLVATFLVRRLRRVEV
jgi:lipopolysaccharide export system permease protein